MSIVSIELKDGELQKLVEYCVEAYVASCRFVYEKGVKSFTTDGLCKSSDRRYLRAEQKLAGFAHALTPQQREQINVCFQVMIDLQTQLREEGLRRKEKRKVAKQYKKATEQYELAIKITSTSVTHDLTANMGKAEAFQMAAACDENDLDALEMAKGMMSEFQGSLPKTAPKPRKIKTTHDKTMSKKAPALMMKQVAQHIKAEKSN